MDGLVSETIKPYVLISIGINDLSAGTSQATFKAYMIDWVQRIKTQLGVGTKIVFTLIPATGSTYRDFCKTIKDICYEENCKYVEVQFIPTSDGYHWTYYGMRILSRRLLEKIFS